MKAIIESIQPVIQHAKDVFINMDAIRLFVDQMSLEELDQSEFSEDTLPYCNSQEEYAGYVFLLASMEFCFWGSPKWGIRTPSGKLMGGSTTLIYCLKRAVEEGKSLLSPQYWRSLTESDLHSILRADSGIPLFHERLAMIRDMGRVVCEEFDGSCLKVFEQAGWETENLVHLIVEKMPTVFRDESSYHGGVVKFYKRAQLLPLYWRDFTKKGLVSREITGCEKITALADYKAPQLLRMYGILKYSSQLAQAIDAQQEISHDSEWEIEIRAQNIWAIELMTQLIKEKCPTATAWQVHNIFWFRSQDRSLSQKPYHHTRTVWY